MNNKGFSIIDLIIVLALFGIILIIGLCASHDMLKTSLLAFRTVSDGEVFTAAMNYAHDNDNLFSDKSYTCVGVNTLIRSGYLADTNDWQLREKIVKVNKGNITKVIYNVEYVNSCD